MSSHTYIRNGILQSRLSLHASRATLCSEYLTQTLALRNEQRQDEDRGAHESQTAEDDLQKTTSPE